MAVRFAGEVMVAVLSVVEACGDVHISHVSHADHVRWCFFSDDAHDDVKSVILFINCCHWGENTMVLSLIAEQRFMVFLGNWLVESHPALLDAP